MEQEGLGSHQNDLVHKVKMIQELPEEMKDVNDDDDIDVVSLLLMMERGVRLRNHRLWWSGTMIWDGILVGFLRRNWVCVGVGIGIGFGILIGI